MSGFSCRRRSYPRASEGGGEPGVQPILSRLVMKMPRLARKVAFVHLNGEHRSHCGRHPSQSAKTMENPEVSRARGGTAAPGLGSWRVRAPVRGENRHRPKSWNDRTMG